MKNELTHTEKLALGFAANARTAKDQATADWHMRAAIRNADKAGLSLEEIEAKAAALTAPKKARCPHYATIREFVKTARAKGLSMADKERARGAMGVYLGKRIGTRAELSAADWERGIKGLEAGVLFW